MVQARDFIPRLAKPIDLCRALAETVLSLSITVMLATSPFLAQGSDQDHGSM